MKCLFFGQEQGSGTSSNMAAVAARLSIKYKKKIILLEAGKGRNVIEPLFYSGVEHRRVRENCAYFLRQGYDYFSQYGDYNAGELERTLKELIPGYLYLFPMGERELPLLQPQSYRDTLKNMVEKLEGLADYVFLDCGTMELRDMRYLKGKDDWCMVTFRQTAECMNRFFLEQYDAANRCFYLMGNYQPASVYNRQNLYRMYRIPPGCCGVVPYNPQFQCACQKGKLKQYLTEHVSLWEQERDKEFRREMDFISEAVMGEYSYGN